MFNSWGITRRALSVVTVGVMAAGALPGAASAATSGVSATINCTLSVHYPHNSTHQPGTVNVTADVECTAAVPAISLAVLLYRDGQKEDSRTFTAQSAIKLSGNAANLACVDGTYRGVASAVVVFPQGFTPPRLNLDNSNEKSVVCRKNAG